MAWEPIAGGIRFSGNAGLNRFKLLHDYIDRCEITEEIYAEVI